MELKGFWTADNTVGIRNRVGVISLSVFSNVATQRISNAVEGTIALIHPHGRAEIGVNRERLHHNLIGHALNPNLQSVLLVGYEAKTTERYTQELRARTKKRIESVTVLELGTIDAVRVGTKLALELSSESSEVTREPMDFADLTVGVKCGSSDATSGIASNPAVGVAVDKIVNHGGKAIFSETTEVLGAEHILAKRAINQVVASKIVTAVKNNENLALSLGVDLMGVNPVPDNIEGGISTIEEKSLGAIRKTGTSKIQDVLQLGQLPKSPGLYFLDYPSAAQEVLTALASTGCQAILFSTGLGNPSGTPVCPVIKVTGNERTMKRIPEHIDVDVSEIITLNRTYEEAGDKIFQYLIKVINGKLTKSELLKHNEFSPVPVGL
jgi:Altronate dehydratase